MRIDIYTRLANLILGKIYLTLCDLKVKPVIDSYFPTKGLWHRCFRVNFSKFIRTPFLQNTSG